MTQRVIHVGVGSFGQRWCREFLAANIADGTIEVVALVDVDPRRSAFGREALGAAAERCYTDAARRLRGGTRRTSARSSCRRTITRRSSTWRSRTALDILCEKPIADTMAASLRVARKVRAAGRKMAVTMSHRFDQDKTTLRRIVRSGELGRVNDVSCRYVATCASTWPGARSSATRCRIR